MSVDLTSNSTFGRISLVILDDCLIKLEHGKTKDRVRKFMFSGIESVLIWRKLPWVRMLVCIIFFVIPGIAILFIGNNVATLCGMGLIALGGGIILWYSYCQKTTVRIVRGGKNYDLTGIFRPGRMRKFVFRLIPAISRAQEAAINGRQLGSDETRSVQLAPPPL